MYKNLTEKVNYEWKKYTCYLRLMSAPDLITHAYEIAVKKAIYKRFMEDAEKDTLEDSLKNIFMDMNDIIDTLYSRAEEKSLTALINGNIDDVLWKQIKGLAVEK